MVRGFENMGRKSKTDDHVTSATPSAWRHGTTVLGRIPGTGPPLVRCARAGTGRNGAEKAATAIITKISRAAGAGGPCLSREVARGIAVPRSTTASYRFGEE